MHLIKFLRPARLAYILLLAPPFAPGFAQEKTPPPARDPYLISIDFPGGSLSKLVASLKADKDARLSIIQSEGLDPTLPSFSVANAPIDSVMVALGRIVEAQGYALNPTGRNVAVLTRLPQHRGQDFTSLQLEGKLGPRTAEDVIAAIQQGCEFANEGRPSTLRFKYHPGTKLLFVAGTEQEVNFAHRIFESLPENPDKAPPPPPNKK